MDIKALNELLEMLKRYKVALDELSDRLHWSRGKINKEQIREDVEATELSIDLLQQIQVAALAELDQDKQKYNEENEIKAYYYNKLIQKWTEEFKQKIESTGIL